VLGFTVMSLLGNVNSLWREVEAGSFNKSSSYHNNELPHHHNEKNNLPQ
jgi:hypothetical protein